MRNYFNITTAILLVTSAMLSACGNKKNIDSDNTATTTPVAEVAKEYLPVSLNWDSLYPNNTVVEIKTNLGYLYVILFNETPIHKANFEEKFGNGFYDSLLFHRVIKNFMIQAGDPDSKNAYPGMPLGAGGPTETLQPEFNQNLIHKRGALAAARMGDEVNPLKKSSVCQFYIVQGMPVPEQDLQMFEQARKIPYTPEQKQFYLEVGGAPNLDMNYTVFGELVAGFDVLDRIADVGVIPEKYEGRGRPFEDVRIEKTTILKRAK